MIRGVQVVCDWKRALASAVKSMIARRRHNPIVPSDVEKVNVQRMSLAIVQLFLRETISRTSSFTAAINVLRPVVGESDKKRFAVSCGLQVIIYMNNWRISICDQVHLKAKIFSWIL